MSAGNKRKYRNLTDAEQRELEQNGCRAESWKTLLISSHYEPDSFPSERVQQVRFSGNVRIGDLSGEVTLPYGILHHAGLYNACLSNVTVGNKVLIRNIGQGISNYTIGDEVVIENCGQIAAVGISSFGNGAEAAVINEGGGREVILYDTLSAQAAHLLALYRHKTVMTANLMKMVRKEAENKKSSVGTIAESAYIADCTIIRNVNIGAHACLEGAGRLENGTIRSSQEDPAFIGMGVSARDFILCEGARVDEHSVIERCFIGQGTRLGKQFSAENSLFFANCEGFHGEACSLFAGPYTVTHHKSTLLIASMVSFFNAGSGTNQSNHRYKLGPNHQGIIERGSKTASDSYLLYPLVTGPFSFVMGRIYSSPDTSEFPFSYLVGEGNTTRLIPAIALQSIGTIRDAVKWPVRDKRNVSEPLDRINFAQLSPYTVSRIMKGIALLEAVESTAEEGADGSVTVKGMLIGNRAVSRGIKLYRLALNRYLGERLAIHLRSMDFSTFEELKKLLKASKGIGDGVWDDISGLLAPRNEIERLLREIEQGRIHTIGMLEEEFFHLFERYNEFEFSWIVTVLEDHLPSSLHEITKNDLITLLRNGVAAAETLSNLCRLDAEKEFADSVQIGYALHDGKEAESLEYRIVNGEISSDSFIREMISAADEMKRRAEKLVERLEALPERSWT